MSSCGALRFERATVFIFITVVRRQFVCCTWVSCKSVSNVRQAVVRMAHFHAVGCCVIKATGNLYTQWERMSGLWFLQLWASRLRLLVYDAVYFSQWVTVFRNNLLLHSLQCHSSNFENKNYIWNFRSINRSKFSPLTIPYLIATFLKPFKSHMELLKWGCSMFTQIRHWPPAADQTALVF